MHRSTTALSLALIGLVSVSAAVAAGSSPAPKTDQGAHVAPYNKGIELMNEKEFTAAAKQFRKALKAKDDFAEAHNNLAYSLRRQGEDHFAEALEHYNRAIELNPKLAEAYMYRGVLYTLLGDEDKALADHATLVELDRGLAEQLQQVIASGEEPEDLTGLAKKW